MKKILSIVGSTAGGKTDLAFFLANRLLDEQKFEQIYLISADSRQVYRGLEITTGADVPTGFTLIKKPTAWLSYWQSPSQMIRLYGTSIIEPTEQWSLAHFSHMAQDIIESSPTNSLVIVIGGTGLYHTHLLSEDPTISVKPNPIIREQADKLSLAELQNWLSQADQQKFQQLNNSDLNNPRRLIRALEVALSQVKPSLESSKSVPNAKQIYFGIKTDLKSIEQKIQQRVEQRWQSGALEEVQKILGLYPEHQLTKLPSASATGFREIAAYLNDQLDASEAKQLWFNREFRYAKRQLTWFKKYSQGFWQDFDQKNQRQVWEKFWDRLIDEVR
ncbi:MAG: tRNA (adenosine(37)-N6)-dimethylallyltransferase [Patescibacteria group bacterium]